MISTRPEEKKVLFSITLEYDDIFNQKNADAIQKIALSALTLLPTAMLASSNLKVAFLKGSLLTKAAIIGSLALAALGLYEIIKVLTADKQIFKH